MTNVDAATSTHTTGRTRGFVWSALLTTNRETAQESVGLVHGEGAPAVVPTTAHQGVRGVICVAGQFVEQFEVALDADVLAVVPPRDRLAAHELAPPVDDGVVGE